MRNIVTIPMVQSWCYEPNGHKLRLLTEEINLTQLCSMATFVGKNTFPESLRDLPFTNIPETVHTISTLPTVSDHLPVLLHTYIPLIESSAPEIDNPGSPRLAIKRANYERVQTAIERSTEKWDWVFNGKKNRQPLAWVDVNVLRVRPGGRPSKATSKVKEN